MNGSRLYIILHTVCCWLFIHRGSIQATEYWVKPTDRTECPPGVLAEHCVTLTHIAANSSKYFTSNTAIHFLPGIHTVTTHQEDVWIGTAPQSAFSSFVVNLTLEGHSHIPNQSHTTGTHYTKQQHAVIDCKQKNIGLAFSWTSKLTLTGLTIINCGFNTIRHGPFRRYFCKPPPSNQQHVSVYTSLFVGNVRDLTLRNVVITESIGFGLLGLPLSGDVKIEGCQFKNNNKRLYQQSITNSTSRIGGNAFVQLDWMGSYVYESKLAISNSVFANTSIEHRSLFYVPCISCINTSSQCAPTDYTAGLSIQPTIIGNYNIRIQNCTFHSNKAPRGANLLMTIHLANTLYAYLPHKSLYSIVINNSIFSMGEADSIGGGIYIHVVDFTARRTPYSISLLEANILNSTFTKNIAGESGGALAIRASLNQQKAESNLYISIHGCNFTGNTAINGAGLHTNIHLYYLSHDWNPQRLYIANCRFAYNRASDFGGAIFSIYEYSKLQFVPSDGACANWYKIEDSIFLRNTALMGSAISLNSIQRTSQSKNCKIELSNCIFARHYSNPVTLEYQTDSTSGNVIDLNAIDYVFIKHTRITDNQCMAIHANMSTIEIGESVWIANNSAIQGAAIFFDCYPPSRSENMSRILVTNATSLYIYNNQAAKLGGGFLFESGCSEPELCFFQTDNATGDSQPLIYMEGNTAQIAGTSIYGGNLEHCLLKNTVLTQNLFWSVFNISEKNQRPSVVASQAYKVCICTTNETLMRSCDFNYNVEVYPGQTFYIPAVGVGQYNYSTPSVIRAILVDPSNVQLGDQQVTQEVGLSCKRLTFSLSTIQGQVVFRLFTETPFQLDAAIPQLQPATVFATILDCPIGFELYRHSNTCDCTAHLANEGVTCDILTQRIHRSGPMWIGNFSDNIVVHHNCPFDYCNESVFDISLYNQEEQCAFQRTGILCGACLPGYNLVLGSSQCKKCSNTYLLLTVPFILAGIFLVVLLLKCNLTVSTGAINGMIFYANLIQVNKKVFFPPEINSIPSYMISIVIAWINLDLGIEICFIKDLNTYVRTWFQFIFPIYIWLLVGLLILVSRYSPTISRLTGTNTVSVLATLFLLSYAKLLRTTFDIFSVTSITDSNSTQHLRWLLDGNLGFLQWPHLTLLLTALLTLVAHLIPFTFFVLLGPTMQSHSDRKVFSWVIRLKPFLDAYQGPYKNKYRYWTGLMLLVRVLLFVVFAGNALGNPNINLLTMLLTVLILLLAWIKVGRVYRKTPVNWLELYYLLNLEITVGTTLYLNATNNSKHLSQAILTGIMVGSALMVFCATVLYYCCSELFKSECGKKLKNRATAFWKSRKKKQDGMKRTEETTHTHVQENVETKPPTRTVVCLRELSLLDD